MNRTDDSDGDSDMENVLLALAIIERLSRLVRQAQKAGEDISDEELQAAFDRADAAEAAWESSDQEGGDSSE